MKAKQPRVFRKPGSKFFWADAYVDGRRVRRSTGQTNREHAIEAAKRIAAGQSVEPPFTIADCLKFREQALLKKLARGDVRPRTVTSFQTAKRALLMGLDEDMPCTDVTQEVVDAFREAERIRERRHTTLEGPLSAWTLNRMVRELKSALRGAFKAGKIGTPVHDKLDGVRRLLPKVDAFSDEERERLIDAARAPWLRRFLVIAAACGPRVSELVGARRSDVRFSDGGAEIFVRDSKTGVPRTLHLVHENAVRVLQEQLASTSGEWVFAKEDGSAYSTGHVQGLVREALKAANLYRPGRGVHTLRRSLLSDLIRSGATFEEVGELGGQRTLQVVKDHYIAAGAVSARARSALARVRR